MPKKKKQESQITAIVCADKNYGIGYNNELLIHIPEDLKHFSRMTSGGTVIMGRKTYESLPNAPLPKRINLVVTRGDHNGTPDETVERGPTYVSMELVKEWLLRKREEKAEEKIAVIGGSQIYEELLPYCDYIHVTKVFKAFDNVDVYFPNIDFSEDWEIVSAGDIMEFDGIKYQYRKYKNLNPIKLDKPKPEKKSRKKKKEE
jgi:dihydrofolate reductase